MAKQNKLKQAGQCRIIAGKWRGRKLVVADIDGLRPTPNRVRETVFNWLQTDLGGSLCLDLFAGSGALGFEAASRGAAGVTLVELNLSASKQLQDNCDELSAKHCHVVNKSAQTFLANNSQQYDIVFIDPPYQANLWADVAAQLVDSNSLVNGATIYLECPSKGDLPKLPSHWQLIKDKKAGEVRYCLFLNNVGEDE